MTTSQNSKMVLKPFKINRVFNWSFLCHGNLLWQGNSVSDAKLTIDQVNFKSVQQFPQEHI